MKAQVKIQDLINRHNTYKAQAWFSKEIWSKLMSFYSNLDHVMASNIIKAIKAIKEGRDDLKLDTEAYAAGFAQLLVDKKVDVGALIGVMREGNLSFSGVHFYKFLDTLHKGYVGAPGLFTEEIQVRMETIKSLPFVGHNDLSNEEKAYIQNSATPLELVDMLIQKPDNMTFADYKDFIESAFTQVGENVVAESRKTEVILLGLKNLMFYENLYTDRFEVEKADGLDELDIQAPVDQITERDRVGVMTKIKSNDWMNVQPGDSQGNRLANKLFYALNSANLIGTGYEKQVVEYVKDAAAENQDKAIQYAIYKAREAAKAAIQTSAESLRKSLIGVAQDLPKVALGNFQKDGQDISVKNLLEKAARSGRLQRAAKRYLVSKLGEKHQLNDAAATVSGHENVQKIAAMFASMDQETFTLIGAVMGQTISEIQSEHNLNPEFWNGTMSRGWNKFTSYPATAFFAVVAFFAIVFEYIGEYVTRGAYKAYEGVFRVADDKKRVDQEIFKQADVEAAIDALVGSLKAVDTKNVKSTAKDELRDAILVFLKDQSNAQDLKDKLSALHDSLVNGDKLKTAIARIKDEADLSGHKKDLQAILDMPEINHGISNSFKKYAEAAKGVAILNLTK